jgi:hypothetical protein
MMTAALIVSAALFAGLVLALGFAALVARWRIRIDLTPVEHAIVAAAAQAGWGYATGDWWAGAAIGIALFVGREHAQAEYRYINAHGGNRYATPLPAEIGCLHPRYWSLGSVLDIAVPAAVCIAIAGVAHALV